MSNAWQYHILKLISRIICLLPYSAVLLLGRLLGRLYYRIASRQRRRALIQLRERLMISSGEQAEKIIRRLFGKLGQNFVEVMYTPALNPDNIRQYVTMENEHDLQEALAEGHGVVILTAHFGNWEWLGAGLALYGYPLTSVVKSQPNDQHTRLLNEYRQMAGIEVFRRGTGDMMGVARAFRRGKMVGFISDQDAGPDGAFVEFLGKMASTPLGAALFARKFKAPVIPAFIMRQPEGRHRIIILPALHFRDTGNERQDLYNFTVQMTGIIEDMIRRHPDEWLWFQKRWNTSYESHITAGTTPAGKEKAGEPV